MLQAVGLIAAVAVACFPAACAASLASLAPGPAACANLTTLLGSSKVASFSLDPRYVVSRNDYWNTLQSNNQPSCVVYPSSAQDVSLTIQAIRATGSRFALQAGGHNPNVGFNSVDKGVLLDLGSMTQKTYDPATTLATYQPTTTFGDLYDYYAQFGVTVVGARLAGVGTGLALGGGLSYLSGQYGMACDSFRELEVVLPSGQITTASQSTNPDLFFALKGGGGNALGVVTKYTVQSRPTGVFYAGNIIYALTGSDRVLKAVKDFIAYNTDPKAAVIATWNYVPIPNVLPGLNTNEGIAIFAVYDGSGTNAGAQAAFQNFTSIPYLFNTLQDTSYVGAVNLPLPYSTLLGKGHNQFRVGVHEVDNTTADAIIAQTRAWVQANQGSFTVFSVDFEPVPQSLIDASQAQGDNAMLLRGPQFYWVNYFLQTPLTLTTAQYNAVQASFKQLVSSAGNAPNRPLFQNDAGADQNPLATYGGYQRILAAQAKYDPDSYFSTHTRTFLSSQ